ncbi:MAG: asparagine synthase C-terminal domain-containing protein, partial [Clostridia bacterium]|nr:asparagine synthase C-terminal domain-containing protein [Clostridia bacterium]
RFVGGSFIFTEQQKSRFLRTFDKDVHFTQRTAPIFESAAGYTPLQKMQHCDLNCWLPSDILVKGDRLSMAHSLEARVPFLDKEVFKAAQCLLDSDKISHGTTKYILRDTFSDLLNSETVVRPKKGYPVPVRIWLKDELFDWAKNILLNNPAPQFIDEQYIISLLEKHASGKGDYYRQIWAVIAFMTWYRLYVTEADKTREKIICGEF